MNNVFSDHILNRQNAFRVIQGNSGDWNNLYSDSQHLESLCRISLSSPARNPHPTRLIKVLELLLHKLSVLIHCSKNLTDYLNGSTLPVLPGSTQAGYVMLLSEKYFRQLQQVVVLLEVFMLAALQATRQDPHRLSNDIAGHYSERIRQYLIPGKLDFHPLSDVIVI